MSRSSGVGSEGGILNLRFQKMLVPAATGSSEFEIRLFGRQAKMVAESMQTPICQLSVVSCQLLRDKTPGVRRLLLARLFLGGNATKNKFVSRQMLVVRWCGGEETYGRANGGVGDPRPTTRAMRDAAGRRPTVARTAGSETRAEQHARCGMRRGGDLRSRERRRPFRCPRPAPNNTRDAGCGGEGTYGRASDGDPPGARDPRRTTRGMRDAAGRRPAVSQTAANLPVPETRAERPQFAERGVQGSGGVISDVSSGVVFREFFPTGVNDLNLGCGSVEFLFRENRHIIIIEQAAHSLCLLLSRKLTHNSK